MMILMVGYLNLYSQVQAGFLIDKTEGCGSLAVNFLDQSTTSSGTITSWTWDLGGVNSAKQNPGRIFTLPGKYTICLTVKTSTGASSTLCKNEVIRVYENPVADFSVDRTTGCVPVTVNFINKSRSANGPITTWVWDVGGSSNLITSSDSLQVIATTYITESKYSPTLSITDSKGCKQTVNKPELIDITAPPRVDIRTELINICSYPWVVKFTNIYAETGVEYQWDFGNGLTYNGLQPPNVNYNQPGSYSIRVIAKKGPCVDTLLFANLVNTERKSDFRTIDTAFCTGLPVKFEDISNFAADSVLWDFGDGNFSKTFNPAHTYVSPGCYTVKLTRFTGNCPDVVSKPCINILPVPQVTYDINNQFTCVIPASVGLTAGPSGSGTFTWTLHGGDLDTTLNGPVHNLSVDKFGAYNATLTYVDKSGCIKKIDSIAIDLVKFEALLPVFPVSGCVPYTATLVDSISSQIPLSSWYWEVGSPAIFTSTDKSPVITVSDTGVWDLKLIVSNIYGCKDTLWRNGYVKGGIPPEVDFTADPLNDCLVTTRNFTAITSSYANRWVWSYGAANTLFSIEKNPMYAIQEPGIFDITLTAFHNGCPKSVTKKDYIEVFKPKSQFAVTYDCQNPNTIGIQNQSMGADSLYWVVHLSDTSRDTLRDSLVNAYTFPGRGIYILSHYSYNEDSGCEHIFADSIFITDIEASYTIDTTSGCAPLAIRLNSQLQDAVSSQVLAGNYVVTENSPQTYTILYTEGGNLPPPILTATDRHGCIDTFQTTETINISKFTAVIDVPDVLCIPDSLRLRDGTQSGLGEIIFRQWYYSGLDTFTSVMDPVFPLDKPGNYLIKIKLEDSWGCKDSTIREFRAVTLIPEFTTDTLSCTPRGVSMFVSSDPTYLNAYSWTFGDGQTSAEKNPVHYYGNEGVYDVCAELFDSRGCSKKICKPSVVRIIDPVADFTGDPVSAPCPPLLTRFSNQSTNALKFIWDFGDNSGLAYNIDPSHVYTSPGSFTVTLIAEMIPGCQDTLTRPGYVFLPGPVANLDFNVTGNCTPLEIILRANSDKPYEYIWDFGDGQIKSVNGLAMGDTISYSYNSPGNYVPKLLVSDDKGCSRVFSVDPVEVNNLMNAFAVSDTTSCGIPSVLSINNETSTTSANVLYTWDITGPENFSSTDPDPEFSISAYGQYNITLISNAKNCTDTLVKEKVVEVAAYPVVAFDTETGQACENTSVNFVNTTQLAYGSVSEWEWDFGDGQTSLQQNPVANFDTTGTFKITLKATTDKGCTGKASLDITIKPNTVIALSDDKQICIGDSINLSAFVQGNVNFTSSWDQHPLIDCRECPVINVKPDTTTTFYIQSVADNGCINRDSIKVTVIPIVGPELILSGDTIVCKNGKIPVSIRNFNPSYRYEWDQNDLGLDCYIDCSMPLASPSDDTWYSVKVYNTYGCIKEDSILVTVEKNIPDFLAAEHSVCEGQNTILSLAGVNAPVWAPDPALSCTHCQNPVVSPLASGYYYVSVTSDAGCSYRDSVYVEVIRIASIHAGKDTLICRGESIKLTGMGTGNVLWTGSYPVTGQNQLNASTAPETTTYYILTATKDQCTLKDTVLISVIEKAEINTQGDTICYGESSLLSATGNATEYLWFSSDGKKIGTGQVEVSPEETTEYKVVGKRSICINDTVSARVFVYAPLDYTQINNKYEVYFNSKALFKADYDPEAGYGYEWTPSEGLSCTDCPEPEVQHITQSTTYTVLVTDINGCQHTETVSVRFNNKCGKAGFYIPNIFTPYNRDGINDEFRIHAEEDAELLSISIFDRWGEKVFESTDPLFAWDGYYKGRSLAQGVYTYIVTAQCALNGEKFNFTGDITIIE